VSDASALTITDETDKSRFGRELPLSVKAREAFDVVCPVTSIIFGSHDFRTLLRPAARAAGIDAYRGGAEFRITISATRAHTLGAGDQSNLSGVMYLAGHKQPRTTARYMRPQKAAAGGCPPGGCGCRPARILATFWLWNDCCEETSRCTGQKAKTPNLSKRFRVSLCARRGT